MKRICAVIVFVALVCSFAAGQTIGENFEGGGVVVGGSAEFFTRFDDYWNVNVNPWVDFLVADGVAMGGGLSAFFDVDEYLEIGIYPSFSCVLGYDPDAQTGPAHMLALWPSITVVGDDVRGPEPRWNTLYELTPAYRLMYFVAPRIAVYAQVTGLTLYHVDFYGWIDNGLATYLDIDIGIGFHHPNKDLVASNM